MFFTCLNFIYKNVYRLLYGTSIVCVLLIYYFQNQLPRQESVMSHSTKETCNLKKCKAKCRDKIVENKTKPTAENPVKNDSSENSDDNTDDVSLTMDDSMIDSPQNAQTRILGKLLRKKISEINNLCVTKLKNLLEKNEQLQLQNIMLMDELKELRYVFMKNDLIFHRKTQSYIKQIEELHKKVEDFKRSKYYPHHNT